jgi:hypothetical protein
MEDSKCEIGLLNSGIFQGIFLTIKNKLKKNKGKLKIN